MKTKFQRIIAPVDGSEASIFAAKEALLMAKETDMPILAIYVLEEPPVTMSIPPSNEFPQWRETLKKEAMDVLNKIEGKGDEMGVKVEKIMTVGIPDDEIINVAKETDLIVMGNKGKTALERLFLGSVTEKVLHHSNASVMVVRS